MLAYGFDDIKDKMVAGEAAVALVYAGDALYSIKQNPDLAYAVPKEGSNLFFDAVVVPANSEHKKEAEMFIDFLCRTDVAKRNADYIEYYTIQTEARKLMEEEDKGEMFAYPSDEELENCEIFTSLDDDTLRLYNDAWTQVTTATK